MNRAAVLAAALLWAACQRATPPPEIPTTGPSEPVEEAPTEPDDGMETKGTYEGRLSSSQIQPVFESKGREIYVCYENGKKKNRHLGGNLRIRFEISPKGEPKNLVVEESTLGDDAVERCISDIIAGLTFPKPQGGSVLAEYPVSFAPKAIAAGVGAPAVEEHEGYLLTAKEALRACQALPSSFGAAVWINAEGVATSAGYSSENEEAQEARACIVEALKSARYPKSRRIMTHLVFSSDELTSIAGR